MTGRPRKSIAADPPSAPSQPNPDHAWKTLSLVNEWVKHGETKSAATLAAAGVGAGVLYNLVKNQSDPSVWLSITAGLSGLLLVLSGLAALGALTPRLHLPTSGWVNRLNEKRRSRNATGDQPPAPATSTADDPANPLFFEHIARDYPRDVHTYPKVLAALAANDAALTEHIARQVHANSLIAHRKFTFANRAVQLLSGGLIFLAATALIVGHH